MENMQPHGDHILVELLEAEKESKGGILFPENAKKGSALWARVVKVGTGRILDNGQRRQFEVLEGDRIAFFKNEGEPYQLDPTSTTKYRFITEADILVAVRE